jgi:hypothetical protein
MYIRENGIIGVIISVLAQSVVDRVFEPWSGRTKDHKTDIYKAHNIKEKEQRLVVSESG